MTTPLENREDGSEPVHTPVQSTFLPRRRSYEQIAGFPYTQDAPLLKRPQDATRLDLDEVLSGWSGLAE